MKVFFLNSATQLSEYLYCICTIKCTTFLRASIIIKDLFNAIYFSNKYKLWIFYHGFKKSFKVLLRYILSVCDSGVKYYCVG